MNIAGLNKAEVLVALYNASSQQGRGSLSTSAELTVEQASAALEGGDGYFDYVGGRVMKVDLSADEVDTWLYNRDNGEGAAEAAVERLRK